MSRATVRQIQALEEAGCEIVRVAVPDEEAARSLGKIRKKISSAARRRYPFRLPPGSHRGGGRGRQAADQSRAISAPADKVAAVVEAAKKAGVPIRIGVNAGSLKSVHGGTSHLTVTQRAAKLKDAALEHIKHPRVASISTTRQSRSKLRTWPRPWKPTGCWPGRRDYPLHLGITEAGSIFRGTIKSRPAWASCSTTGWANGPRLPDRGPGGRGEGRLSDPAVAGPALDRDRDHFLPHVFARCAVDLIAIVNELEAKTRRRCTAWPRPSGNDR